MAATDDLIGRSEQSLRIEALRGGTVTEVVSFLADVEASYNALYSFGLIISDWRQRRRYWRRFFGPEELFGLLQLETNPALHPDFADHVLPEYQLALRRVSIQSPGFWEFVGGLNPLQQLREYLKDRHERRKDHEYREPAEKDRLRLDNELLQRLILEKETSILRDQLAIMREFGFGDAELRQFIWSRLGPPLSRLGRHQDSGLIAAPLDDGSHE